MIFEEKNDDADDIFDLFLVFCAEPEGKNLEAILRSDKTPEKTGILLDTIADGTRTKDIGDKCLPIIKECCEKEVLTITEAEIRFAQKLIFQRLKVKLYKNSTLINVCLGGRGAECGDAPCRFSTLS